MPNFLQQAALQKQLLSMYWWPHPPVCQTAVLSLAQFETHPLKVYQLQTLYTCRHWWHLWNVNTFFQSRPSPFDLLGIWSYNLGWFLVLLKTYGFYSFNYTNRIVSFCSKHHEAQAPNILWSCFVRHYHCFQHLLQGVGWGGGITTYIYVYVDSFFQTKSTVVNNGDVLTCFYNCFFCEYQDIGLETDCHAVLLVETNIWTNIQTENMFLNKI